MPEHTPALRAAQIPLQPTAGRRSRRAGQPRRRPGTGQRRPAAHRSGPARRLRRPARGRGPRRLRQPAAARPAHRARPDRPRRGLRHRADLRHAARPRHLRRHPGRLQRPGRARPAGARRAQARRAPAAGHQGRPATPPWRPRSTWPRTSAAPGRPASSTPSCAGWPPATWTPGSRSSRPDRSRDPSGYLAVRHSYPRWIVDAFRDALGPASAAETRGRPRRRQRPARGGPRPQSRPGRPPAVPGCDRPLAGRRTDPLVALRLPAGRRRPGAPRRQRPGRRPGRGQPAGRARPDPDRPGPRPGRPWTPWTPWTPGRRGPALARPVRGPRRQGPAAGRPRRRPRRPPGRLGHPPAPGAARPGRPAPRRAARSPAVLAADGRQVPWPPGTFDRVLADVPCSGLGSLRRRPEARWRKTPADVAELAGLQRELLNAAIDSVRPGGVVAYVTCSPHLAETRDVVTAVVAKPGRRHHPRRARRPPRGSRPARPRPDPIPRFAQFWPHRHGTDAIFLALLRRS